MHFSCLNLFLASLASSRGQKQREASDKFKQLKCISIICSFFCWLPSRCSSVGWRAKQGKRVKIRKTRSEDRQLRRNPSANSARADGNGRRTHSQISRGARTTGRIKTPTTGRSSHRYSPAANWTSATAAISDCTQCCPSSRATSHPPNKKSTPPPGL